MNGTVMVAWVCLVPVVLGSLYSMVCLFCVLRFRVLAVPSTSPARDRPPVTMLKPVYGTEKTLEANLRSACQQDYPTYQVVLCVQRPDDPAVPILRKLEREFGAERVTVVVEDCRVGTNGKMNNLIGGLRYARHELLVISDSDILLKPDYLSTITAPLADPDVGLVCTFFMATSAGSWFEKMELLTMNTVFFPDTVLAFMTGINFCIGSSVALRRSTILEIGGFEALADYLVEDYEMGRRIWQRGKRMVAVPYVVQTVIDLKTAGQWWNHQVYWDQNNVTVRPGPLLGTLVVRPIPFALFFAIVRVADPLGLAVLGGAVALRVVCAAAMLHAGLRDREGLKALPLLPFRDLTGFVSLVLAFVKPTAVWRDTTYTLSRDGRMRVKGAYRCESSSSPETTSALRSR